MEKKQIDWKFVIGTIILTGVLVLGAGFFWKTVARQAALVKEEEAREETSARHAIYMYYGKYFKKPVFVDMDTNELFTCSIPKQGIYNRNGVLIQGDIPEEGDKLRIYGDNLFTDGQPPRYDGVVKMQRTGRATLEEAEVYRKIVEEASEKWISDEPAKEN